MSSADRSRELQLVEHDVEAAIACHMSAAHAEVAAKYPEFAKTLVLDDSDVALIRNVETLAFPSAEDVAAITPETAVDVLGRMAAAFDVTSALRAWSYYLPHVATDDAKALSAHLAAALEVHKPCSTPALFRKYFDAIFPFTYSRSLRVAVLAAIVTRLLLRALCYDARTDIDLGDVFTQLSRRLFTVPLTHTLLLTEITLATNTALRLRSSGSFLAEAAARPNSGGDVCGCGDTGGLAPDDFGDTFEFRVLALTERAIDFNVWVDTGGDGAAQPREDLGLVPALTNLLVTLLWRAKYQVAPGITGLFAWRTVAGAAAMALKVLPLVHVLLLRAYELAPVETLGLVFERYVPAAKAAPSYSGPFYHFSTAFHDGMRKGSRKGSLTPCRSDANDGLVSPKAQRYANLLRAACGLLSPARSALEACNWAVPFTPESHSAATAMISGAKQAASSAQAPSSAAAADASSAVPTAEQERNCGVWTAAARVAASKIADATPVPAAKLLSAARTDTRRSSECYASVVAAATAGGWKSQFQASDSTYTMDRVWAVAPHTTPAVTGLACVVVEFCASAFAILAPALVAMPPDVRDALGPLTQIMLRHGDVTGYSRAVAAATLLLRFRAAAVIAASSSPSGRLASSLVAAGYAPDFVRGLTAIAPRALTAPVGLPSSEADAAVGSDASAAVALVQMLANSPIDTLPLAMGQVDTALSEDDTCACPPGAEILPIMVRAGLFPAFLAAAQTVKADMGAKASWAGGLPSLLSKVTTSVCRWLLVNSRAASLPTLSTTATPGEFTYEDANGACRTLPEVSEWTAAWVRANITDPLVAADALGVPWRSQHLREEMRQGLTQILGYMSHTDISWAEQ